MKKVELRKVRNLIFGLTMMLGLIIGIIVFQNLTTTKGDGNPIIEFADSGATGSQTAKATLPGSAIGGISQFG